MSAPNIIKVFTCTHPTWIVPTLDTGCDDDVIEGKCPDCWARKRLIVEDWKHHEGVSVGEESGEGNLK